MLFSCFRSGIPVLYTVLLKAFIDLLLQIKGFPDVNSNERQKGQHFKMIIEQKKWTLPDDSQLFVVFMKSVLLAILTEFFLKAPLILLQHTCKSALGKDAHFNLYQFSQKG